MEKSNLEKIKETLLYAPVGAFGFVKDNAPTFFNMFVSRGKRDVTKTTLNAEEKISTTKEHGQMMAMGTPVMKTKFDQLANEAKSKGEVLAHFGIDTAIGALGFLESAVKNIADAVSPDSSKPTIVQTPHLSSVQAAASPPVVNREVVEEELETTDPWAPSQQNSSIHFDEPHFNPATFNEGEGDFVAEPVNELLPAKLRAEYEKLSAPEIIDMLDEFPKADLSTIRKYETDFRNRQTIIHAINYRLDHNA